jgi:hypothetical protein
MTQQSQSIEHVSPEKKNDPKLVGEWGPTIQLENVAVHTHVLPNGKVLYWGRRPYKYEGIEAGNQDDYTREGTKVAEQDEAAKKEAKRREDKYGTDYLKENPVKGNKEFNNHQDHHMCTPLIWDPSNPKDPPKPTPHPVCEEPQCGESSPRVNLFCGGHAFMPDGRLLVAGGHCQDGVGTTQACTYDYKTNTWAPLTVMSENDLGRWYPTVTALADGTMLVMGGTSKGKTNTMPEVWDGDQWRAYDSPGPLTPNYPCMHVAPDGRVCISGPQGVVTWLFDPKDGGIAELKPGRTCGHRDYAPSVMYDAGKIIYIGGGNDLDDWHPTNRAEVIDLNQDNPKWRELKHRMHYLRRQHNATILADGTVLVIGGTQGGGAERSNKFTRLGFNNLEPGNPVHEPELWDPDTEEWTLLAKDPDCVDRCYHSMAVLLPDATVLSAGGGEYDDVWVGKPWYDHNHYDGKVFKPPYLFGGDRPETTSVGKETINYGDKFTLMTSGPEIGKVTLVRLSSVTHTINQNQRFNSLMFTRGEAGKVSVTAPEKPEICPPGHYMLFAISTAGVPSKAQIIQILAKVPSAPAKAATAPKETASASYTEQVDDANMAQSTGTRVTVGLATQCIYGLGSCWGGAYQALTELDGVAAVRPVPNAEDSTAEVYLRDGGLPDLDNWPGQFTSIVNGSYDFRGVEVTITGTVREHNGTLRLTGPADDHPVTLRPLAQGTKVQWDAATHRARDATRDELDAYQQLAEWHRDRTDEAEPTGVTGPLTKTDTEWNLYVRVTER